MLLGQDELLGRLESLVKKATAIDVATAWASPGKAMDLILQRAGSVRVRAIIGTAGWATHPVALRRFASAGQLRIPTKAPLFHPKVILFHHQGTATAWIGSANLTRSGYQQNLELMFETDKGDEFKAWFDGVWSSLPREVEQVIQDYENNWSPEKAFREPIADLAEAAGGPSAIVPLPEGADWRTFVDAIRDANSFWKSHGDFWTVDGEGPSWLTTINLGNAILARSDLEDITYLEYRILLGIEFDHEHSGYGLLGSMRGAGLAKEAFNPTNGQSASVRNRVRKLLQPVIDSKFDDFPDVASKFVEEVSNLDGFAGSVATRFVALARPDLGISVNKGSRALLERYSGLPAATLSKPRRPRAMGSYAALLEYLQTQPWYRSPAPQDAYERMLADCRGALLDAIAYGYGWQG